jgi:anti-sigma-K factor RskA
MTDRQHISQEDLALYALQTLPPGESAAVREHLFRCDVCQTELAALNGDLAMLALGVDQSPLPVGARDRFVQRIANDSRFHPAPAKSAEPIVIVRSRKAHMGGWAGWLAAAAILIVAIGLGFQVSSLRKRLHDMDSKIANLQAGKSQAEQVAELLTAPVAQRVLLTSPKTPATPSGRVVYLKSRGALILQANNLAPIPADKSYELWLIPANGSAPIPAGLFRPDAAGNGSVLLPPIPTGVSAKAFGVTMEDAAGSQTPTAPILLMGTVSESGM